MNRTQRRIYNREAAELEKLIGWIEPEFSKQLFDEADTTSYISLFMDYDYAWRKLVDEWNPKAKLIEVDRLYFWNTYKPLENLKP